MAKPSSPIASAKADLNSAIEEAVAFANRPDVRAAAGLAEATDPRLYLLVRIAGVSPDGGPYFRNSRYGRIRYLSAPGRDLVVEGQEIVVHYDPDGGLADLVCFEDESPIVGEGLCQKCGVDYSDFPCQDCHRAGHHAPDCIELLADEGAIADGLSAAREE